jgi:hypothetical protein
MPPVSIFSQVKSRKMRLLFLVRVVVHGRTSSSNEAVVINKQADPVIDLRR